LYERAKKKNKTSREQGLNLKKIICDELKLKDWTKKNSNLYKRISDKNKKLKEKGS